MALLLALAVNVGVEHHGGELRRRPSWSGSTDELAADVYVVTLQRRAQANEVRGRRLLADEPEDSRRAARRPRRARASAACR